MESYFFLTIGYWNLIGSIALYFMLNPAIADKVLRQWTETITQPYDNGQYGSIWLIWAATTNVFFGVINLFAVHWETATKVIIIGCDGFVYGIFLLAMIVTRKNAFYGRGMDVTSVLSIVWIIWAGHLLFTLLSQ